MTRTLFSFVGLAIWLAAAPSALAQNTPPVANNDMAAIDAGALLILDVLANDTDADGDTLEILSLPTLPSKGQAIIFTTESGQHVEYRSNPNASGTDTFTYRISDGHGGEDEALVTVALIQNAPPVAHDDAVSLFSHQVVDVDVLANDTDPEGDSLRIQRLLETPRHGTAEIIDTAGGQRVRYDPDNIFAGKDSLLYEIADLRNHVDTARVRFTVTINQAPVAVDDEATVFINETVELNVLANDTDAEGDTLRIFSIADAPDHGDVTLVSDSTRLQYTPDPGFLGTDTFVYTLSDGIPHGHSPIGDQATVVVRVLPPSESFEAILSGAHVMPSAQTRASGLVVATLDDNQLALSGAFSGLGSDVSAQAGPVLQLALAGEGDGVSLFDLTATLSADRRNGSFTHENNTFLLTAEQVTALFDRRLSILIRTEARPDGELRGQLLPAGADQLLRAVLSGRAVRPSTASGAYGMVIAERFGNTLTLSGAFAALEADVLRNASGARVHQGLIGTNGDPLFDLNLTLETDRRGGTFEQRENRFVLTNEQIQLLDNGLTYLVIRTDDARDGEIRGQLLPFSQRVFEVALSGDNEVPPVPGTATGGLTATLESATLAVSGTFGGLASDVDLSIRNGAHIHQAAPNANGAILFELATVLTADRRGGSFANGANQLTLPPEALSALFDGDLYVNIHTVDNPGGALRGQLLPSPNVAPPPTAITAPTAGAVIDFADAPATPVLVAWPAVRDANGNTVYYRWQLARSNTFNTVLYEAEGTTAAALTTTTGALDQALMAAGVTVNEPITLYHRVVTTDGGLQTNGPAGAVVLTRGVPTGVDTADAIPKRFAVPGNYPNPFNPITSIQVDLPQPAHVRVDVYDLLGRLVLATPEQPVEAGAGRAVAVDARTLSSGLYVYRVVARSGTETVTGTGRMTLVK